MRTSCLSRSIRELLSGPECMKRPSCASASWKKYVHSRDRDSWMWEPEAESLGITALKLGGQGSAAEPDLDENAIAAVGENLAANGYRAATDLPWYLRETSLTTRQYQDRAGYESYDVAVANILADVIILLVRRRSRYTSKKGGIFRHIPVSST